ncbi:MAG: S8/S53 family peptidase [bacterium]|nr:S8/S53 family peptidase [bacterium]
MSAPRAAALAVLLALGLGAPATAVVGPSVPRGLGTLQALGDAPDALPLPRVLVHLGVRDPAGLAAVVAAQQDPRSPTYRRWLEPAEIADRFGVPVADYERARRWFRTHGFAIVADSPFRTGFAIAGTAGRARSALKTRLALYRMRGRVRRAPVTEPRVPAALGVRGFFGLDDLPAIQPLARLGDGSLRLAPADFATVYDVGPLHAAGLSGAGSSVAVVARSDFQDADVAAFRTRFQAGAPARVARILAGRHNPGIRPERVEQVEVTLDTEWAGALAPNANVFVVLGSPAGDIQEALERTVTERIGDVISISFGLCEPLANRVGVEVFDALYGIAALRGQTVVVAAGDAGATDCAPDLPGRAAVSGMASSPYVIAVGGTALRPVFDPAGDAVAFGEETVWNDASGAGGGGVSAVFARPTYQLLAGAFAGRALPDLSLAASPSTPGYVIVQDGASISIGGTSAGAPALASVLTLANERAGTQGLGNVGPTLYRIAADAAAGRRPAVFRDVVAGSNGYPAGPGFDLASGWGSPLASALVEALATTAPEVCDTPLACFVPGTGGARRNCLGGWLVEQPNLRRSRRGIPLRRQTCRDGDPSCDADGRADGRCLVRVAMCANVFDARDPAPDGLSRCTTRPLRRIRLVTPRTQAAGERGAAAAELAGALAALPLPDDRAGACTATVPVVVPVGRGGLRLVAQVRAQGARTQATLRLVCEAAAQGDT